MAIDHERAKARRDITGSLSDIRPFADKVRVLDSTACEPRLDEIVVGPEFVALGSIALLQATVVPYTPIPTAIMPAPWPAFQSVSHR